MIGRSLALLGSRAVFSSLAHSCHITHFIPTLLQQYAIAVRCVTMYYISQDSALMHITRSITSSDFSIVDILVLLLHFLCRILNIVFQDSYWRSSNIGGRCVGNKGPSEQKESPKIEVVVWQWSVHPSCSAIIDSKISTCAGRVLSSLTHVALLLFSWVGVTSPAF